MSSRINMQKYSEVLYTCKSKLASVPTYVHVMFIFFVTTKEGALSEVFRDNRTRARGKSSWNDDKWQLRAKNRDHISSSSPRGRLGAQIMYDITEKKAVGGTPETRLTLLISPLSKWMFHIRHVSSKGSKVTVVSICIRSLPLNPSATPSCSFLPPQPTFQATATSINFLHERDSAPRARPWRASRNREKARSGIPFFEGGGYEH